MNKEEKILFYWSGEAGDDLSLEVEELLESDDKARAYFDDLGEWAVALTDEKVPERRTGLLDEVLESRPKIVSFRTGTILALVATLVVAGFAVFLAMSGTSKPDVTVEAPPAPAKAPTMTLSKRILSDSGSFRSCQGGLEETSRQRRRWRKMRNPQKKT